VYQPIWFSAVMATGIVALALREQGFHVASWVLAALAAATWLALVIAHLRSRPRPRSRGEAVDLFAFVAATEVLASLSRWHNLSFALWALGAAVWLPVVVVVLATPAEPEDAVKGSWLLATVATDSLAVSGAPLARHAGSDFGVALAATAWILALALYCVVVGAILRRIRRREIGRAHV